MALDWKWDENIPQKIKDDKKSDEMVRQFLDAFAKDRLDFTGSSHATFCDDQDDEPETPSVDYRPQWKIDNENNFKKHVAEMEEWLKANDMRHHPYVKAAFERFLETADPETTLSINYYDKGDALRDYDDYEDLFYGV